MLRECLPIHSINLFKSAIVSTFKRYINLNFSKSRFA